MPDLFEITLADGIPVAGDGDVKTINALMEDGALATVGHVTDTAIANTDASPATVVALLKQLSKVLQDLRADWPTALGTGGGLKVESSNAPIDVSGSVDITYKSGMSSVASFTSGTPTYAANSVVGGAAGSAALTFPAVALAPATIEISTVALAIYRSGVITGETSYRLYLYSASPPSALADGAVFDIPSGDRSAFLGYVDLPVMEDVGSTLVAEINGLDKIVKTEGTAIYGYLVTKGGYVGTAATYRVTISCRVV